LHLHEVEHSLGRGEFDSQEGEGILFREWEGQLLSKAGVHADFDEGVVDQAASKNASLCEAVPCQG